jgi:hypothetical protein
MTFGIFLLNVLLNNVNLQMKPVLDIVFNILISWEGVCVQNITIVPVTVHWFIASASYTDKYLSHSFLLSWFSRKLITSIIGLSITQRPMNLLYVSIVMVTSMKQQL